MTGRQGKQGPEPSSNVQEGRAACWGVCFARSGLLKVRIYGFHFSSYKNRMQIKSLWANTESFLKVFVLLSKEIECQIGFVKWQSN